MMYEDLRSLSDVSYRRIIKLDAIEQMLTEKLENETQLKNKYSRLFTEKEQECSKLKDDLAEKKRLLDNEIKTHNELKQEFKIREERIETMAGEIEESKQRIENLNNQIGDLQIDKQDNENKIEELETEKAALEKRLEEKVRITRWTQTGKNLEKLQPKETGCQTEHHGAMTSFGHISDGAEHNLAFDGDT